MVSGGGGSRGIWDWLWFSCGVARSGGGGGLISVFGKFSASIGKTFTLAWRLGAGLSFCEALRQPVRQLVYAMFISNNRPPFHLW